MGSTGILASTAVAFVARLCLGFFFLSASFGKLANRGKFTQGIVDYDILPDRLARTFAVVVPWVELGVALTLILGIALRLAAMVTVLLLISFIIAITANLQRDRQLECNCYGIISPSSISWGTVVRNILFLLFAIPVIGLTTNAVSFEQWFVLWRADLLLFSSTRSSILLSLLLAFCIVTIYLVEWALYVSYRVSQFETRSD